MKNNKKIDDILLFCAFRYALGRMTYVVSHVANIIQSNSEHMEDIEKEKYVKEILEYFNNQGKIGMSFDTEVWLKLACFLDNSNSYDLEANYYKTDKWESIKNAFKFKGEYYARSDSMGALHTVRNIKNNSEVPALTEDLKENFKINIE